MKSAACTKKCAHKNVISLPTGVDRQLEEKIRVKSRENRLSCSAARAIADELKLSPQEIRALLDKLNIRVTQCQLGCF